MKNNCVEPADDTIKRVCEDYIFHDDVCSDERTSLLTKLDTFKNLNNSKLKVFENMTDLDSEAINKYTETQAMKDLFESLYNDLLTLDNRRLNCISMLCTIIRKLDKNSEVPKNIKEYEY